MTPEQIRQLNQQVNQQKKLRRFVLIGNTALPVLVAVLYLIGLVIELAGGHRKEALLLILLPAAAFALTTALRRLIRKPRPCQAMELEPVTSRRSESYSMPSRHLTSAFAIGTSLLALSHPVLGVVVLALGILIGAARVLGGVHYLTDVLAGAGIGVLCGLVVCWLR